MIRDAAFSFSTEQSITAAPVFPGTSTNGYMSTNYYDVGDLQACGGREQYVEVEFTEACDINCTLGLAIWPDYGLAFVPDPSLVAAQGHRFISQYQLLVSDGGCAKGERHYLPLRSADRGMLTNGLAWRYLNVFYLGASATTGAVTARLVDANTHNPRAFAAQNDT